MRKIIAAAWAAALILCASAAWAAEWREGLHPGQPYATLPAVDLTQEIGYMMFYPNEGMPATAVCRTLYIYLPREDVLAGEGTLRLSAVEDGPVLDVAMNDETLVRHRAMTEDELDAWLWGSGSCFEIQLPRALEWGKTYYATMAKACVTTEAGIDSPAISGQYSWRFALAGEYAVSGLEYRRPLADGAYETVLTPAQPGDEITFDLVLGGEAASATLYSRGASVDFPTVHTERSMQVTGVVTADAPAWGVMFFDAQGEMLDQLEF